MRAEAGRVGERGGLVHPAAARERLEVAEVGPLPPGRGTLVDELRDAEPGEPLGLARVLGDVEAGAPGDRDEVLDGYVTGDVVVARGVERRRQPVGGPGRCAAIPS